MLIPQLLRRTRTLPQTRPTARRALKNRAPCVACRQSGYALPPAGHTRRSLIQIGFFRIFGAGGFTSRSNKLIDSES